MGQKHRTVVVRPYARSFRGEVFAALERAGCELVSTVPAGTPDRAVVEHLATLDCDLLLMPFHAHRDEHGELVNGLELLLALREQGSRHALTPVLCPVSKVGLAAAGLITSRTGGELPGPVLLVEEDDLEASRLEGQLRRFLRAARHPGG